MKAAFALVLVAGCAHARVRYEPVVWPASPPPNTRVWVEEVVARDQARGKLGELTTEAGVVAPESLPLPVLWSLWLYGPYNRGGEVDARVTWRDETLDSTLWIAKNRDVRLAWGEAPTVHPAPPSDALVRKYRLAGIREEAGGHWTPAELAATALALDSLAADEVRGLEGLAIVRRAISPRNANRETAFYDPTTVPPRIEVYDAAFEADPDGFCGVPGAGEPVSVLTLLHEFGHAYADAPIRRLYDVYQATWDDGGDDVAAWDAYRAEQRADPVIAAYRAARGREVGPTRYGGKDVYESFADAFALHHCDPDALARVMPDTGAWFAAGGHVAALAQADAAAP